MDGGTVLAKGNTHVQLCPNPGFTGHCSSAPLRIKLLSGLLSALILQSPQTTLSSLSIHSLWGGLIPAAHTLHRVQHKHINVLEPSPAHLSSSLSYPDMFAEHPKTFPNALIQRERTNHFNRGTRGFAGPLTSKAVDL